MQKRKSANNKPRDATTPHGATAAESVRNLIKKNARYSKRINYDALRDLFDGAGPVEDEKLNVDGDMWTMDANKEDEAVFIEEGGGAVGMAPVAAHPGAPADDSQGHSTAEQQTVEADLDDMYADGYDKGDHYAGDWDAYEQEV